MSDNNLSGLISNSICNQGDTTPNLNNNNFCFPYPSCLTIENIGDQNTSECYLIYDLNGDQILNVLDILILVDAVIGSENIEFGDFNLDGILNISDIIILINLIFDT